MIVRKHKNIISAVGHSVDPPIQLPLFFYTVDTHIDRNDMKSLFLFFGVFGCVLYVCLIVEGREKPTS